MARVCQICGRGTQVGISRSHSNRATKRTKKINLQVARIDGERMRVCTNCLKTRRKRNKG